MMEKFYKLVYDVTCFYIFTSFFFFLAFRTETDMPAYGVLLLAVMLNVFLERTARGNRLSLVVLAVPLACLLKAGHIVEKLQVLLPWLYLVIVVIKEQYGLYYEEFKSRFKGMMAALLIPLIVFCCTDDFELGKAAMQQMLPFLFLFFASGVLLTQNLRFGADGNGRKEFERHQIGQMIIFFLFCILVTTGRIMQFISDSVLLPLIKAVLAAAIGLLYKIYEIMMLPAEHNEAVNAAYEERYGPEPSISPTMMPEALPEATEIPEPDPVVAETTPEILFVCLAVIVAVALFFVLRGSVKKKSGEAVIEDERETLEEVEAPVKKVKKHSLHPDIVVRYNYRKFMEKTNSGDIKVVRSDTTSEIREKFLQKDSGKAEETEELTNIYRKVRYTDEAVTKEDAVRVKALMKKILG